MWPIKNIFLFLLGFLATGNSLAAAGNTGDADLSACRAVASAASRGDLGALIIPEPRLEHVDVNNDGKPERVEYGRDGLNAFDKSDHPIEITLDNESEWGSEDVRWVDDFSLVEVGRRTYVLGKADGHPRYLARIDKENVERLVCKFGVRTNLRESLIHSKNDRLCRAVLARNVEYVNFDRHHAISVAQVRKAGFDPSRSGKLAAYVDIDNDGNKRYVIALGASAGGGNSCDGVHLWVIDKARNKQDEPLTKQLPEWVCGTVDRSIFAFDGATYIKARSVENGQVIHQVFQLKRGHIEKLCDYTMNAAYYLIDEDQRIFEKAGSAHMDPWVYALEMSGTDGLQAMMDAGHDMRIHVHSGIFTTVLHEAIRRRKYAQLQFLLENGVDPNLRLTDDETDPVNEPLLIFSVEVNSKESVRLLMQYGANPNVAWKGKTAKEWVAISVPSEKDKAAILELLSAR